MRTALARLGDLVRTLRLSKSLTQEQLACLVEPKTNRSAVAHLEQGLRVPKAEILRSICLYLGVPNSAWSYLEDAESSSPSVAASGNERLPRVVAVAGIPGSGKSTFARGIAARLNAIYLPEEMPAKKYLGDLGSDRKRWAFETQLAFLCFNSLQIMQKSRAGHRIVLDRSLEEDVYIFAQSFRDSEDIDERAFQTYQALADYFIAQVPIPDLIVLCNCSAEAAFIRIQKRARADKVMHTLEHLRSLESRYGLYFSQSQSNERFIFPIDTEKVDFRQANALARTIEDSLNFWLKNQKTSEQLIFQSLDSNTEAEDLPAVIASALSYPVAYIAAPFTGMAINPPETEQAQLQLFDLKPLHGRIGKGRYRDTLTGIAKSVESLGIRTILPHRDVNRWGDVTIPPSKVMSQCTKHVLSCDIFIGLLGNSTGSHYEFGLAMGAGKTSILIHCEEIKDSYMARGGSSLGSNVLNLYCTSLREVPLLLLKSEVIDFIGRELGITPTLALETNGGQNNG